MRVKQIKLLNDKCRCRSISRGHVAVLRRRLWAIPSEWAWHPKSRVFPPSSRLAILPPSRRTIARQIRHKLLFRWKHKCRKKRCRFWELHQVELLLVLARCWTIWRIIRRCSCKRMLWLARRGTTADSHYLASSWYIQQECSLPKTTRLPPPTTSSTTRSPPPATNETSYQSVPKNQA